MTLLWNISSIRGDKESVSELAGFNVNRSADIGRAEETAASTAYPKFKLSLEWLAALLLLVLLTPLLIVLPILVKLTSEGPAIYSQLRLGRGGRRFWIHKLRTMTHQCEAGTGPVWSGADDPRVTRIGRWLRGTHLDEIPQLINVLRGDMALVGPRPERPEIANRIERTLPDFSDRLSVRPGITGLAQIRMPADTDLYAVHRKLTHDLYYIRHLSLALDARIMLATLFHFLGASAMSKYLIQPHTPSMDDQRLPDVDIETVPLNYRINVVHAQAA